jgi:hypothetical protein
VAGAFSIVLLEGAPHRFPADSLPLPLDELAGGIDPMKKEKTVVG